MSELFGFSREGYNVLRANNISVNELFVLDLVEKGQDLEGLGFKFKSFVETCKRNRFLVDDRVTLLGHKLMDEIVGQSPTVQVLPTVYIPTFEDWWKVWPNTDKHGVFAATRTLKVSKGKCKKKFEDIINEGQYTIPELIGAVELEVAMRKKTSTEKKNEMKFMASTEPYLNKRLFEGFVEEFRNKEPEKVKQTIDPKDLF